MTHLNVGIDLINQGRYFEAHEVLEEDWAQAPQRERFFLQGLIHIAVAFHHASRGNLSGAIRQIEKGIPKLAGYLPEHSGVDTRALCADALCWRECWRAGRDASTPAIMLVRKT